MRCAGKKTALLQAEASVCVLGLANVLFGGRLVILFFSVENITVGFFRLGELNRVGLWNITK